MAVISLTFVVQLALTRTITMLQIVNQYIGNSLEPSTQTYSMNIQQYEVIVAVFLIPLVFIRDMKVLAPFSMLANITSVVGLFIILYYILVAETLQPVSRLPLIKSWAEIPLYLSTAIYAFEGIGVVSISQQILFFIQQIINYRNSFTHCGSFRLQLSQFSTCTSNRSNSTIIKCNSSHTCL